MEIYTLYLSISTLCSEFVQSGGMITIHKTPQSLTLGLLIAVAVWAALFALQGVGLYTIAKRKGLEEKWLVFVPFANLIYIGKLAGSCEVFGHKMKNAGLYAMIAQIVTALCCSFIIFAEIYLYTVYGAPDYIAMDLGLPVWTNLSGAGVTIAEIYNISDYILSIIQLVYQILLLILLMGLYKRYSPRNYMMFSFLSLFIPITRYFVVFGIRNKPEVDYEAYMRARREAFMRQQGYRPYNPYANPYGNPYGHPYGGAYGQQNSEKDSVSEPEDPFAEFANSEKHAQGNGENAAQDGMENSSESAGGNTFDSFFS